MEHAHESARVVQELRDHVADNTGFGEQLTRSLAAAKQAADGSLNAALFDVLVWPTDLDGYYSYLEWFAEWTPVPGDEDVWLAPGTDEHQEVVDRLTHFYFLIDQPDEADGTIMQSEQWFSDWLVLYARAWGSYLDTTDSFDQASLEGFLNNSPEFRVQDSMIDGRPNSPSGWLTFNQFFARELNPGLRPIASPMDNTLVVSTADCTFKASFPIDGDSRIPEITVKKTHKFASVEDLLEGSQYKDEFKNGHYVHYFLGPYSYHRFHVPVSGKLVECRSVPGRVFLDVGLEDGQFTAPDSSTQGYEFSQARGITIVDTTGSPYGDIGLVAAIPVGMAQVSSVNMTGTVGSQVLKGDEFGYFLFGGSDTILLFQSKANARIFETGSNYVHYGEAIAQCYPDS